MTQTHAVAVYTKPSCPPCDATKRRMTSKSIAFTAIDITEDQGAYDFVVGLGHQRTPVVVLDDDTHWSGFQPDRIDKIQEKA